MHRFLFSAADLKDTLCTLNEEETRHAIRVLRLQPGDPVELSDGGGALYSATLKAVLNGRAVCEIDGVLPSREPPVNVTLYQGLVKYEKLEFIAQKATELGVTRIVPVAMSRSVVHLDETEAEKKQARMQKICAEAAKQCGRAVIPEVLSLISFSEAAERMRKHDIMLMPWEMSRENWLPEIYTLNQSASDIGLLIGPEGGISESEAHQANAIAVTLGPRILRAETAAVVAVALVMQLWGDM